MKGDSWLRQEQSLDREWQIVLVIRHEGRLLQVSCIKENTICSMGNIQKSGIISVHRLSELS